MKRKISLLFFLSLVLNQFSFVAAATLGSATAMSQQAATGIGASTTMLDGCIFAAGFNTSGTNQTAMGWSSQFPVLVTANWQGATIALLRNFIFGSNATFSSAAIFNCNGFAVIGPERSSTFTIGSALTINGGTLKLNSTTAVTSTITFQGTSVLDGGGNVINMSGGTISVAAGATLTIQNATLINVGNIFTMGSTTSSIIFEDVEMVLTGNTAISQGAVTFTGNVSIDAPQEFLLSTAQAITISTLSSLYLAPHVILGFSNDNLTFADATAQLYMNRALVFVGGTSLTLTTGNIIFQNACQFYSSGSPTVNFGNGVSDPDIQILSGAAILFSNGTLDYNIVSSSNFTMQDSTSIITMASGTTLALSLNMPNGNGIINFQNAVLSQHAGAVIVNSSNVFGTLTYTTF